MLRHVRFVAIALACLAFPATAQDPGLRMLDNLQAGSWELRYRDASISSQRICLNNGRQLVRLRHTSRKCNNVIVDDAAAIVTVQYTCPGHGYGRTSIRRETDRLVQIDSQGIADGIPFAFAAEARRSGGC